MTKSTDVHSRLLCGIPRYENVRLNWVNVGVKALPEKKVNGSENHRNATWLPFILLLSVQHMIRVCR